MTPTPKLRWAERQLNAGEAAKQSLPTFLSVRILQQWWAVERAGQITPTGEWRDVPLEKEQ
jgi:hypothetical protein